MIKPGEIAIVGAAESTRIGHRIQRGIGMQHDLRHVGDGAELGGLGRADDGDFTWLDHGVSPPSPDGTTPA